MSKLLISALVVFGAMSARAASSVQCVDTTRLDSYTVVDDTHLQYQADDGSYVFTLSAGCDLQFADAIGFKTMDVGFNQVCTMDQVVTYQQGMGQTSWCDIQSIDKQ